MAKPVLTIRGCWSRHRTEKNHFTNFPEKREIHLNLGDREIKLFLSKMREICHKIGGTGISTKYISDAATHVCHVHGVAVCIDWVPVRLALDGTLVERHDVLCATNKMLRYLLRHFQATLHNFTVLCILGYTFILYLLQVR